MMNTQSKSTELQRILAITTEWSRRFQKGGANFDPGPLESIFGAKGGCVVGGDAVRGLSANASAALGGHGSVPRYEVMSSHIEEGMAFLAGVENIVTPGGPGMKLRFTHVYRCEEGNWVLVHRHADPYRESPFEASQQ